MMRSLVTRRAKCVLIKSLCCRWIGANDAFHYKLSVTAVSTPELGFFCCHFLGELYTLAKVMDWGIMHQWCKEERWDFLETLDLCQAGWYSVCSVEAGKTWLPLKLQQSENKKTFGWKKRHESQLSPETQLNRPDSPSSPARYISLLLVMLHVKVLCKATVTQTASSPQMVPFCPTLFISVLTHIHPSPFSVLLQHVQDVVGGWSAVRRTEEWEPMLLPALK